MVVAFLANRIPTKSFNTTDQIFLFISLVSAFISVPLGITFSQSSPIDCYHKTISETKESSLMTYVYNKCSEKNGVKSQQNINFSLLILSNILVILLSIVYGISVKDRVEKFKSRTGDTTPGSTNENDTTPLTSHRMTNTRNHWKCLGCLSTFSIYIIHLVVARIIPLMVFVIFFYQSYIPKHFLCQYRHQTGLKSSTNSNVTLKSSYNLLNIGCTNNKAGRNEALFHTFAACDIVLVLWTIVQIGRITCKAWNDKDFMTDEEFCKVYLLEEREGAKKIVNRVRKRFNSVYEGDLQKMLQRTVAFDGKVYYKEREILIDNDDKRDLLSEMFEPEENKYPRTICVIGQSRTGKTTLARELLYQWIKEEAHKFLNDKILILLECNEIKDKNFTCHGLFAQAKGFSHVCRPVSSIPSKAVLIFDGLDDLDEKSGEDIGSENEEMPVLSIFKSLLYGCYLPGATVLATLRPTAPPVFQELEFDRKIEIFGFSELRINDYVSRRITDENACEKVKAQINESGELLSFCYIPVNCFIVCVTLEKSNENSQSSATPKTLTETYTRAVKVLTSSSSVSVHDCENFSSHIVIAESGAKQDFKEYTTAVESLNVDLEIDKFLDDHKDSKSHLLLQFFAGLLGDKIKTARKKGGKSISQGDITGILDQIIERLKEWIRPLSQQVVPTQRNLALLATKFLYELQDRPTTRSVCRNFLAEGEDELTMNGLEITPACSPALFKFLGNITNLKRLSFNQCTTIRGGNMYRGMAKWLFNNPDNSSITFFSWHKNFPDVDLKNLSKALTETNCLTELHLLENGIECKGVKNLSVALQNQACGITVLNLAKNAIKDKGVDHLAKALANENCNVTELDLSENEITNDGVEHLLEALKSGNFKLESLILRSCKKIAEQVMNRLKQALEGKKCKLIVQTIRQSP